MTTRTSASEHRLNLLLMVLLQQSATTHVCMADAAVIDLCCIAGCFGRKRPSRGVVPLACGRAAAVDDCTSVDIPGCICSLNGCWL
jgi:hypothetical protein